LTHIKEKFDSAGGRAPDCDCGGYIKSATISFGQAMPEQAMLRAQEWAQDCDLFVAIGSSLVVWPAAGFPLQAKKNGSRLVIINREPTEFDSIADLVIRHDIGDTLAPLIAH
jgi:NAD-dependent deacetylase